MAEPGRRRQIAESAAINAVLSIVFFVALFGMPGRALAWAAPDRLAFDFLPQSAMIGLMSALVPPLLLRKARVAAGLTCRSAKAIVVSALGWALLALAAGGAAAVLASTLADPAVAGWTALILKTLYGATLGAAITSRAVTRVTA